MGRSGTADLSGARAAAAHAICILASTAAQVLRHDGQQARPRTSPDHSVLVDDMETITLNGVEMPALGLGVFQTPPAETRDAVRAAPTPGTATSTPQRPTPDPADDLGWVLDRRPAGT
jgi:hypothetical protein